jgi:hypothetical protein
MAVTMTNLGKGAMTRPLQAVTMTEPPGYGPKPSLAVSPVNELTARKNIYLFVRPVLMRAAGVNHLGNKERLVQNQAHTKNELEVSEMSLIGEVGLARKYCTGEDF